MIEDVWIFMLGIYFGGAFVSFSEAAVSKVESPWFFLWVTFAWPFNIVLVLYDEWMS